MSKISENQPARITKIVEKWLNYSKVEKERDKTNPSTCLHAHCIFWRNKHKILENLKKQNKKLSEKIKKDEE